jgi:hypothetical protein
MDSVTINTKRPEIVVKKRKPNCRHCHRTHAHAWSECTKCGRRQCFTNFFDALNWIEVYHQNP